jgi:hypothetical protein
MAINRSPCHSQPGTQPLTADEYERLLTAVPASLDGDHIQERRDKTQQRLHGLIQLMRWSGLSVRDAATLKRSSIRHDEAKGIYRIVTQREKMRKKGTGHVSVPIPAGIARELLAVANGNPEYFFWTGKWDQANSGGVLHQAHCGNVYRCQDPG